MHASEGFAPFRGYRTWYHKMNGPSDFHVTGNLRHWSVVERLPEIRVPTLVVTGEHDEATPCLTDSSAALRNGC